MRKRGGRKGVKRVTDKDVLMIRQKSRKKIIKTVLIGTSSTVATFAPLIAFGCSGKGA